MDDTPTLRNAIEVAISSFCSEHGFGIPTGFVYCVSRIDSEGDNCLTLGSMEGQQTAISMGLAAYLSKNFEFEAESELTAWHYAACADDEDDD